MKAANLLFLLFAIGCAQAVEKTESPKTPEGWKTLDEKEYSIQYPDTFNLDISGQMGSSFVIFSKITSDDDHFGENVNLLIQDLSGADIDLDRFVEVSEKQANTELDNSEIIESSRLSAHQREYHKLIYTAALKNFNMKWLQYYWVVDEKAYILTLTCEENQYDNYIVVGEQILNSFRIK